MTINCSEYYFKVLVRPVEILDQNKYSGAKIIASHVDAQERERPSLLLYSRGFGTFVLVIELITKCEQPKRTKNKHELLLYNDHLA